VSEMIRLAFPKGDTLIVQPTSYAPSVPSRRSSLHSGGGRYRAPSTASSIYSGYADDDTFSVRSGASTPPSSVPSSMKGNSMSSLAVDETSSPNGHGSQGRSVASPAIRGASEARRHPRNRDSVRFFCEVKGCGSDFTTKSNLQGEMTSISPFRDRIRSLSSLSRPHAFAHRRETLCVPRWLRPRLCPPVGHAPSRGKAPP
jgi:hypothetical protein